MEVLHLVSLQISQCTHSEIYTGMLDWRGLQQPSLYTGGTTEVGKDRYLPFLNVSQNKHDKETKFGVDHCFPQLNIYTGFDYIPNKIFQNI